MSSKVSDTAIALENVSKAYRLYQKPVHRLLEAMPWFKKKHQVRQALHGIDLTIQKGEVWGVVGRNGAGKSTLLQLICGTLQPSTGRVEVNGRIAALLELGAGFNPEFTGRENVWMNASIYGLSHKQISEKFAAIHAFSEIGDAIDQPVKTYSSGMFMRLAFSVAISVEPEVLVIDEALSVGDGAFAKKSFDRIMQLKNAGTTILFCSHSLYQVEALCEKALWINEGRIEEIGSSAKVVSAYQDYLDGYVNQDDREAETTLKQQLATAQPNQRLPRIKGFEISKGATSSRPGQPLAIESEKEDLWVHVALFSPDDMPVPTLGILINTASGIGVCSFSTKIDGFELKHGTQKLTLQVPDLPLLKGQYVVDAFLLCERGIHVYEHLQGAARFHVKQDHIELGVVRLKRNWTLENGRS